MNWKYIYINETHYIIYNISKNKYISLNYKNEYILIKDINLAIPFINNKVYISPLRKKFLDINIPNIIKTESPIIWTILLAAGTSSRFNANKSKQLYEIDNKPIISYSIDLFSKYSNVIIVTNSKCYDEIYSLYNQFVILINDINDRIESINTGITYINKSNINKSNIIIHDVARPFVCDQYIKKIIKLIPKYNYIQYVIKINNGLFKLNNYINESINRDDFVELCTPLCINIDVFNYIWNNFIYKKNITCEFLYILNLLIGHSDYKYKLLYGENTYLRKITTFTDTKNLLL